MKKKLAIMLLALASCLCLAIGFSACGDGGTSDGGTSDGGNSGTTDDGGSSSGGDTSGGGSTSGSTSHTMTYYAANEATCTEDGNTAYYYCSDCGKYFSDAEGNTEIALSDTIISAKGHSYTAEFTWTRTDDGYTATVTGTCSNCGDEQTVDATVTSETTPATCTENGSIVYTATAVFGDETLTDTKSLSIKATDHTYSEEWSSDGSYHWHAAICEHTDEISEKAEHTFVSDGNGGYVCSVCGYSVTANTISSGSDSLVLGDNYIYLEDTSTYINGNISYTADKDGYYTVTIPGDCTSFVYIETPYESETLGLVDETATSQISTATFALQTGDSIAITYIGTPSGISRDSAYLFSLSLTCVEATIEYGSVILPYALDLLNSQDQTVTIGAGESCYFTVGSYNYLTQVYITNADLKLYKVEDSGDTECTLTYDGTNYCYYLYVTYGVTYTFYLKNTTDAEISDTVSFYQWEPSLSEGTNTVTLDTSCLSNKSIKYTFSFAAGTAYTMTLGEGTDSSVAIKSSSSSYATTYLGNGTEATSYLFGGTSASTLAFYINYTGSESSFTAVIVITKYEEDTTENEEGVTYQELTLDTAVSGTVVSYTYYTASSYVKAYYSYTSSSAGMYSFTVGSNNNLITYSASSVAVIVNGTEYTSASLVYSIPLVSGYNTIVIKFTTKTWNYTLTGTLSLSSGSTETTALPLSIGSNAVSEDTLYSFTATDAGTYTFTVSGTNGFAQFYTGADYTATNLFDEQGGDTEYVVELSANETIDLYMTNGSDGNFVVNIEYSASGSGDSSSTANTLSLGDNAITDVDYSGTNMTFTVTEDGTYTFSVTSGASNAYVSYNNVSYRITPESTSFSVSLTAGTYTILVAAYSADTTASYTLNITKA